MTCFETLNPTIEAWTSINFSVEFENEDVWGWRILWKVFLDICHWKIIIVQEVIHMPCYL